jgi:hypothetical protein
MTTSPAPATTAAALPPRTNTPDHDWLDDDGHRRTTITLKRSCNGCGQGLGDATDAEVDRAIAGQPEQDVRGECPNCAPVVALEKAGCQTWQVTPRSFPTVMHQIDQLRPWVFTKGYWKEVDGKLQVVGLRVGEDYTDRVVAFWGDWIIRHPDGHYSTHKAPAAQDGGEAA